LNKSQIANIHFLKANDTQKYITKAELIDSEIDLHRRLTLSIHLSLPQIQRHTHTHTLSLSLSLSLCVPACSYFLHTIRTHARTDARSHARTLICKHWLI